MGRRPPESGGEPALLRGPRVELCPPTREDGPEFLAAVAASEALHAGYVDPPATEEDYRAWSQRARSETCAGFLIRRRADGALLGVANLNQIRVHEVPPRASLGCYGLLGASQVTGHGYVEEAVRLLAAFGASARGVAVLEAEVQRENTRSLAMLQRLGFAATDLPPRLLRVGGGWRPHDCLRASCPMAE